MFNIQFESLDEAFDCYGKDNLIPISNLQQMIFYAKHGCQPKFIFENELKPGRITCWYFKNESEFVYNKWLKEHPKQNLAE